MHVQLTPAQVLHELQGHLKPRVDRLHLGSLYVDGRRYRLILSNSGFELTSTYKVLWHHRRRTSVAAVLNGTFHQAEKDRTTLQLKGRMQLFYLLDAIWLPIFFITLVIASPWFLWLKIVLSLMLVGLYWFGHRTHAMLEIQQMLFFIQKVLESEIASAPAGLPAENPHLVLQGQHAFEEAWTKFYEQHRE